MTFKEFAALLALPDSDVTIQDIRGVTEDSRKVQPGYVFFAAQGDKFDGHAFADDVRERGALAIVGEREGVRELSGLPYLRVPHVRRALGIAAQAFAGYPSRDITVIGVTGTNGKTSVVWLTQRLLNAAGRTAAGLGTIGHYIGDEKLVASHTTPFGEELAELMAKARDAGAKYVAMEASSHALEQERVAGVEFDVGVFTNLTQDHLDFHADMDAYCASKLKLFERIHGEDRFTVVNRDDPSAQAFIDASRVDCVTYGKKGQVKAVKIKLGMRETRFRVDTPWGDQEIVMPLLGRYNVWNALAAIAVCGRLRVPMETIAKALAEMPPVPGRFERVDVGQDFQVIVDYAHTEDGLRNVLESARKIGEKRLITVFGCGGDRDRTKRPRMAAAAAQYSDYCIITSDNPRTEDPMRILLDIEMGIQHAGKRKDDDYLVIQDRAEAITRAIDMADTGDLVVIAGKGHEDYQILGTERIHFDDREVARSVLSEL